MYIRIKICSSSWNKFSIILIIVNCIIAYKLKKNSDQLEVLESYSVVIMNNPWNTILRKSYLISPFFLFLEIEYQDKRS